MTKDDYAKAIISEGQRRGISPRGIQIALSVALVESGMRNYANRYIPASLLIPHDAVGADHDSLGLFQQRCPLWGPPEVLMDPAKSAGLFYDRLATMDYNDLRREPGSFAADIQRPAAEYRGRYQARFGDAATLYNQLAGDTPAYMIPRRNADFWWGIAMPRDGKPYGYGGPWIEDDVNVTTDCSGLVSNCLEALVRGPEGFTWGREPYSTESWRVLDYGQIGPFGTICVRSPKDIPKDAAVGIGLHHGGGGPDSHMGCTVFDPVRGQINVESSGDYGQRIGGPARGLYLPDGHTFWSYWNDWAYLPGPIEGEDDLLMSDQPYESLSPYKRAGDPSHTLAEYIRYTDGSVHALVVEFGAITLEDPACVELVQEAADRGVPRALRALEKIKQLRGHPQT